VALVRNSGTLTLYINGTSAGATSTASTFSDTQFNAGYSPIGQYLNGYVSNIRYVNGQALYTTNFTPPAAPLSAPANTTLLLSGTNSGAYDSTMINDFLNIGGVYVSSNNTKYGTNSYYFNGSSYLSITSNPAFNFGTGNFTIECWIYPTSFTNGNGTILSNNIASYSSGAVILKSNHTGKIGFGAYDFSSIGTDLVSYSNTGLSNTWTHVALVRSGTTFTLYVNGINQSTATSSITVNFSTVNTLIGYDGAYDGSSSYYTGYIQDLRITNGIARYTSNFTPTATPFLAQ